MILRPAPSLRYFLWNSQFQDQKPIYAAIYGGRTSIFGRNNPAGPDEHKAVCMRSGQQLVFGEQLGWLSPNILQEKETAEFHLSTVWSQPKRRFFCHVLYPSIQVKRLFFSPAENQLLPVLGVCLIKGLEH